MEGVGLGTMNQGATSNAPKILNQIRCTRDLAVVGRRTDSRKCNRGANGRSTALWCGNGSVDRHDPHHPTDSSSSTVSPTLQAFRIRNTICPPLGRDLWFNEHCLRTTLGIVRETSGIIALRGAKARCELLERSLLIGWKR